MSPGLGGIARDGPESVAWPAFHRSPAADLGALRDLLLRVSRLAEDLPEVSEFDLNPVIARPDGVFVVDARVKVTAFAAAGSVPAQIALTREAFQGRAPSSVRILGVFGTSRRRNPYAVGVVQLGAIESNTQEPSKTS